MQKKVRYRLFTLNILRLHKHSDIFQATENGSTPEQRLLYYEPIISSKELPEAIVHGYEIVFMLLDPCRLPIGVVSLSGSSKMIIRVPAAEIDPHRRDKTIVAAIGMAQVIVCYLDWQ